MEDLNILRNKIDEINEELRRLFLERMKISKAVVEFKMKSGMEIFDSEREKEVIEKVLGMDDSKEMKPYLDEFFTNLMEISREYQQEVRDKEKK
ncbi:chorismate mutase [Alkalibacter mobilis]|uniref:chorismate mutase n=1 Tax=Alkalibacter mobilis TaxID=2787712 RepID=UPI00189C7948|nr:chorismate mutase [Alkalibacter mobilis]MBF7096433.1 chorismate mutase [Alkalibacter mobilis]